MAKQHKLNKLKTLGVAIIAVPLLLYGASSFDASSTSGTGIKVGDKTVSQERVLAEVDYEATRYAQQLQLDVADMPPALRAIAQEKVTSRIVSALLLHELAAESGLLATDEQVTELIRSMSEFKVDGKFSVTRFNALIDNKAEFVRRMRDEASGNSIKKPFLAAGIGVEEMAKLLSNFQSERRTVRRIAVPINYHDAELEITAEEAEAYYNNRQSEYEQPARVQLAYIHVTRADVKDRVIVDEAGLRDAHERRVRAGLANEERQLSLLKLASEDEANAALEELRGGADFAELVRERSLDAGTKEVGGDLGFLTRDDLDEKMAEELFNAQIGDLVGPFADDDGWLLFWLKGKIGGSDIKFADVRDDLLKQVQVEQQEIKLNELATELEVLAQEQGATLPSVATELGLAVQQSDWLTEAMNAASAPAPFAEDFILGEALGAELRDSGVNSSLLRKEDGSYLVMRVTEYEPQVLLTLEEVADEVNARVRRIKAQRQVIEQMNEDLGNLLEGKSVPQVDFDAVAAVAVDLLATADELAEIDFTQKERNDVFSAGVQSSAGGLPAYYGNYYEELEAVVMYRIDTITPGDGGTQQVLDLALASLVDSDAQLLLIGYLADESVRVKVEVTLPSTQAEVPVDN